MKFVPLLVATVTVTERCVELPLCKTNHKVLSFSFHAETPEQAHGVFQRIWNKRLDHQYSAVLRDNPYFLSPPSSSGIIPDFDMPGNGENSGRFVAYYHVCRHMTLDEILYQVLQPYISDRTSLIPR